MIKNKESKTMKKKIYKNDRLFKTKKLIKKLKKKKRI